MWKTLSNAIKKELKTIEYNFPFLRLDYIENKGIDNLIDQTDEIISKLNSRCIKMDTNKHLLTHNVIERLKLIIRIDKYLENDGYNSIDDVSLREFEYNFIYDFLVFFDLMNFTKQINLSNSRRIDIISTKTFPTVSDFFDEYYELIIIKIGIGINKSSYKENLMNYN